MTPILLPLALLLLALSALLSAAEAATFSVTSSHLRTLREEGFRRADTLHRLRDDGAEVRAFLFLSNTVLNTLVVGFVTLDGTLRGGGVGGVIGVFSGVLAVILLGEGLPRRLATRRSIRVALAFAPMVDEVERRLAPLASPFSRLEALLSRNGEDDEEVAREREVRDLTELGRKEGVVEEEESDLVERAFRMDELTAWDIMTPRVDIFAWRDSLTLDEVVALSRTVPYSRVPVYGESVDDITGVVHVREVYEAHIAGRGEMTLRELAREPFFVPGSLPLPRLLRDFQARRIHLGIVADEFGGTDGLVTLEDVIEELVGEIEDETDILEEPLVRVSKNEAVADASVELREVNQVFNLTLPFLEHRSLNGFILEETGRVPQAGETVTVPGVEIEILEASDTQVLRARIRKTSATPAPTPE